MMDRSIITVLGVLAGAIVLFLSNRMRPDLAAILVLMALVIAGSVTTEEALAGFGSTAVVTVAALLVIGAGLVRTGVVQCIADCLKWLAGKSQNRLLLASTALPGVLSGFVNIIAAVSLFIPAVLHLSQRSNVAARSLLLPMAATALAGANLTLIGAGHNLVVNDLIETAGVKPFGLFELAPAGAILLGLIVAYNWLFAARLLSLEETQLEIGSADAPDRLVRLYELADFLWEVWVKPEAAVIGQPLNQIGIGRKYGLSVLSVVRAQGRHHIQKGELRIQDDDILLLGGRQSRVLQLCSEVRGLHLEGHPRAQEAFPSSRAELIEVSVPPRSTAIQKTVRDLHLRESTGLTAIALWREGKPYRTEVMDRPLREGDAILLFGERTKARQFEPAPMLQWMQPPRKEEAPQELRYLGPWTAAVLVAVVLVSALGWLSIATAALLGGAGMIFLGALSPKQAYESIDWRVIVLIAAMLPLGTALQKTGAAQLLSDLIVNSLGPFGPRGVLLAVAGLALLLTQVMHNAAVAVIVAPIAVDAAASLQSNPKAFGVAVIIGASAAFLLPVGHPALLLVQEPGRYRTRDYLKYGTGLVVITGLVIAVFVPIFWPL